MQNTTLRIPPAAELGEVAYRTWVTHERSFSAGSWATWQQLGDDDRQQWGLVGLAVFELVKKANEHA